MAKTARRYHVGYTMPKEGEIFVFGSNLRGIHGLCAAKIAYHQLGAIWGKGIGNQGQCYALPTKGMHIETLELPVIEQYVKKFLRYAAKHENQVFFITRVGCELAGYKDSQIAPMFKEAGSNFDFPIEWKPYL